MSIRNNYLKIYDNSYIRENLNVLGNININNDLFLNKLEIRHKLIVNNFSYINKNLNINKDLLTTNIKENALLNIMNNMFVEDSLNSDSSLNCNNIDSKNFNLYLNKKKKNYLFNNNVLIHNTTNIKYYAKLTNLFLYNDLLSKNLDCISANLNIIKTKDADTNNIDTNYEITVNNKMRLEGYLNLLGDINVKNNLNIRYSNIRFEENSSFVVGRNNYNYIQSYGIRTNLEENTLEACTNNEWRPITQLSTADYKTKIIFNEYDSIDAHNIDIIQNNNLSIQFNNIKQEMCIYKNVVNIYNNLNINDGLKCNSNLNIKQNLICNNDLFINGLLRLPIELKEKGMLRYNIKKKEIEFNKDKWGYINMSNLDNGIIIDDNDSLDLYTNKEHSDGLILNNNINIIKNNLTIKSNVVCSSGIEIKNNMNVKNTIYFNNKGELKSNINSIIAYVSPNYNNININNYKYFNINDEIKDEYLLNIYESNFYYSRLYNNNLNDIVSSELFYNKDIIINNHIKLYSFIYSTYDLMIKNFEIYSILKNNENMLYNEGLLLNHLYLIIIYDDSNNIIFNNTNYNKEYFILKKEINYRIKIQKKTNLNELVDVLIRLKGYYYNDILLENGMSKFLYKIDNIFRAETTFERDLNLKNNINLEKKIISNNFKIDKIEINPNINSDKINSNIFSIYNDINENIFSINGNNIIFGNYNSKIDINLNQIYIKTPKNKESLYIEGDSIIEKNMNVLYDLNIENNCIIDNINYNNLIIKNNLILNNNLKINNNIKIKDLISENLNIYNDNIKINNLQNIENIYCNNLKNNNIIVDKNYINFNNKLYINYENNININSDESFNLFSIGNKINPNLSISPNGMIEIYTNKLILNNIDIINELNLINNKIV